jgi:Putative MetA-pathway of phenol degradation
MQKVRAVRKSLSAMSEALQAPPVTLAGFSIGSLGRDKAHPLDGEGPINNPDGDYLHGVGDADFQAAFIHDLDKRWAVGFGARLIAPTGDDALGSGKWQIMPVAGFRYALPEINSFNYLEPLVRYDVSFAGDSTKRNISNLQFAPTFNLGLPDRWFITYDPSADIRINLGDPITSESSTVRECPPEHQLAAAPAH